MNSTNDERLIELEVKLSHQEIAIEELQKSLFEQHLTIERLEKKLKLLLDRVEGSLNPEVGPGNQKPPHY
jgi:SlyX protein